MRETYVLLKLWRLERAKQRYAGDFTSLVSGLLPETDQGGFFVDCVINRWVAAREIRRR